MRFPARSFVGTLCLAAGYSVAMAQHSGSGSGAHSHNAPKVADSATHRRDNSDAVLGHGAHHGGAAEELTRIEHQPTSGATASSVRPKPLPKMAVLPKLDGEGAHKGTAIKVTGHSRSSKGLVANTGANKGAGAASSPGRRY